MEPTSPYYLDSDMEKIILSVKNCKPNIKLDVDLQHKIFFYVVAEAMWKKIFWLAYHNCEGCIFPERIKHSCLYLWNPAYLKENNLGERFIQMYYDDAVSQLNWIDDLTVERNICQHIDWRIYNESYWKTRHRKDYLRLMLTRYIVAVATEDDDLICHILSTTA